MQLAILHLHRPLVQKLGRYVFPVWLLLNTFYRQLYKIFDRASKERNHFWLLLPIQKSTENQVILSRELTQMTQYIGHILILQKTCTEELLHILNTGIDVLHLRRSNVFLEDGKEDFKKPTARIMNSCPIMGKSLRHAVSKGSTLPNQQSSKSKGLPQLV